jgi:hypothetical protein
MFSIEIFNNYPILVYQKTIDSKKIYYNSRHNPVKECQRYLQKKDIASNDLIILFGIGLGYILEIIRQTVPVQNIILIEKNIEIINLLKNERNNVLKSVKLFTLENINELYKFFETLNLKNYRKVTYLFQPIEKRLFGDLYNDIYEQLKNIFDSNISKDITVRVFAELFYKNFFLNINSLLSDIEFSKLKQFTTDKNAVLISAGPSLNNNIDILKFYQNSFFIFAVDTVADALIDYGIIPDFIVTLDPQPISINHFKHKIYNKSALIYEPTACPSVIEKFSKRYFVSTGFPLMTYINNIDELDDTGGSVATFTFKIIENLNFKTLILVGQDLSVSTSFYSKHTSYFEKRFAVLNKFNTMETYEYNNYLNYKILQVKGNKASFVYTTYSLLEYLKWFNKNAQLSKMKIYNTALNGAFIENTEVNSFKNIVSSLKLNEINKNVVLKTINEKKIQKSELLNLIETDIIKLKKIDSLNLSLNEKKILDLIKLLLYNQNNLTKNVIKENVFKYEEIFNQCKELI